jgi:hypothetical protein
MEEVGKVPEKKCSHCKAMIPRQAAFCPFCGKKPGSISMLAIIVALVVLVILGLLASTNPGERDFEDYVSGKINAQMKEKGGSGNFFEQFLGRAAGMTASKMTRRDNYVLFSIFEFEASFIRLIKPDFPRIRFLGIAGRIIPLSKVNLEELATPAAGPAQPPSPPAPPPPQDQQGAVGTPQPTPVTPGSQVPASPPDKVQGPPSHQPAAPQDAAEVRRQKQADYQRKMEEHLRKLKEAGRSR